MRKANTYLLVTRLAAAAAFGLVFMPNFGALAKQQNLHGSWDCSCSKVGTCTYVSSGGASQCFKAAKDTCDGTCVLTTSTTGAQGSSPTHAKPPGGGTAGTVGIHTPPTTGGTQR
jgi:hypothetical protein